MDCPQRAVAPPALSAVEPKVQVLPRPQHRTPEHPMKPTLALLTPALLLTGCSSSRGKVTARADEGHTLLAQSFNSAYITSNRVGEYDVILVQDPQATPPASAAKKTWKSLLPGASTPTARPLQPLASDHLKQVVHIHVFWQAQ